MTSSKAQPSILMVGLPAHSPNVPQHMQQTVEDSIHRCFDLFKAVDVELVHALVEPGQLQPLEKELRAKRFDGVVIGNGIRANMELTPTMEQVIEMVHRMAPHAVLIFNTAPDDSLDAVRRWFPNIRRS